MLYLIVFVLIVYFLIGGEPNLAQYTNLENAVRDTMEFNLSFQSDGDSEGSDDNETEHVHNPTESGEVVSRVLVTIL